MLKKIFILGVMSVNTQAATIGDCEGSTQQLIQFLVNDQGAHYRNFISSHDFVAQFTQTTINFFSVSSLEKMEFIGSNVINEDHTGYPACSKASVYVRSKEFTPDLPSILDQKTMEENKLLYCANAHNPQFDQEAKRLLATMHVCCLYDETKIEKKQEYSEEQKKLLKMMRSTGYSSPTYWFYSQYEYANDEQDVWGFSLGLKQ